MIARRLGLVALLLVAMVTGLVSVASAAHPWTVQLKWDEVGSIVLTDTTFVTDEADTIRTGWVETDDWDWPAILAQGSVATGWPIARITFVASRATNGVTDTLNVLMEAGTKISAGKTALATSLKPDTMFAHAGTILATIGTVAVATFQTDPVFVGYLFADIDSPGEVGKNGWMIPRFRLRVCGDQSGSTPKLSGVFGFLTYLRKDSAR